MKAPIRLDHNSAQANHQLGAIAVPPGTSANIGQLAQGWYLIGCENFYGYTVTGFISKGAQPDLQTNPFGSPGLLQTTSGRQFSSERPIMVYVPDSGEEYKITYLGQYWLLAFVERVPAPCEGMVEP